MSGLRKQRPVKSVLVCQEFSFPKTGAAARERRAQKTTEDSQKLLKYIDDNIIGKGILFFGPFGRRKVVYANYFTTGRSLQFLEDYICKEVLPAFGDIDCCSSVTGLQSHLYDKESREIIAHAINATEQDEIIFCNNPSARLAQLFGRGYSHDNGDEETSRQNGLVLFVSNLEPDDKIQSWIEAGAEIEKIEKNRDGFFDLIDLEKKLAKHRESGKMLVALFSTISRLTGILSDDVATTILLHQHNAISVWNYSYSCASTPINMNPDLPLAAKDAIFFNCSNMVGGLQASGVLVVKKSLLHNCSSIQAELINSINIVRCGLVMQLKETLGTHIMTRNEKICKQILSHIRTIPEIYLLGPSTTIARKVPTVCFLIKHPRGTFLHHKFVVAILNDVFGIQSTASNLIHETLGISDTLKVEYEQFIDKGVESISPGYTRLSFPFFMTDNEIGFILESLKMVAQEGWKLLPQYEVGGNGEWRHLTNALAKERKWLHSIRYNDGRMLFNDRRISAPDRLPQNYGDCLQTARNIFSRARKTAQRSNSDDSFFTSSSNEQAEKLRWYILPREAHELLLGPSQNVKNEAPFDPKKIIERSLSLDIRRFQKSKSLIDSLQTPKKSPPPEKQHSIEFSSPPSPSPIVRFTLGGDTKCAMTSFSSHHLTPSSRNSCSDSEQDIRAYVKEVTREISDEIKSEIREVISTVEDKLESSDMGDIFSNNSSSLNVVEDTRRATPSAAEVAAATTTSSSELTVDINSVTKETKLALREQGSVDASKIFRDSIEEEKQRSESLPTQIYTGAISKLKSVPYKELSSQDSGINLSFHDDERKKAKNFTDEKHILEKDSD